MRNRKKDCFICVKEKETLYRCRYEEKFLERNRAYEEWVFVCEYCLKDIKKKFEESYQTLAQINFEKNYAAFFVFVYELVTKGGDFTLILLLVFIELIVVWISLHNSYFSKLTHS